MLNLSRGASLMRVSVIVAGYNEGKNLARTLDSVVETAGKLDYELVVVDDASTDDSIAEVRVKHPGAQIVSHVERQGTAGAKAAGADQAKGEVLLFLDGHTKPEAGALEALVEDVKDLEGKAIA
jgi:glycosyltransferase involved in cell wall biosynthesis